jgi:hypothetical protein
MSKRLLPLPWKVPHTSKGIVLLTIMLTLSVTLLLKLATLTLDTSWSSFVMAFTHLLLVALARWKLPNLLMMIPLGGIT